MTRRERLYGMGRRGYEGGGGCASAAREVWRHDGGSSPGIRDARMPSSRSQLERYPYSYRHARHTGRGAASAAEGGGDDELVEDELVHEERRRAAIDAPGQRPSLEEPEAKPSSPSSCTPAA